MLLVLAKLKL